MLLEVIANRAPDSGWCQGCLRSQTERLSALDVGRLNCSSIKGQIVMKKKLLLSWTIVGCFVLWPVVAMADYGDIIINDAANAMRDADVKDVRFPHWFHMIRYKCKACHEGIYTLGSGANHTDMKKIKSGESCGKCHNGAIARATEKCEVCHSLEPGWRKGPMQFSEQISPGTATRQKTGDNEN